MTRMVERNGIQAARHAVFLAILVVGIWWGAGAQTPKTWRSGATTVTLSSDGILRVSGNGAMGDVVGYYPWNNDSSITGLIIEEGVTHIGDGAFGKLSGLKSATVSSSVKSIGKDAFFGCTNLTSISVNKDNLAYISVDGVLFNKTKDTLMQYPIAKQGGTYTIPNSVTTVGEKAFLGCIGLKSITLSNSVKSIGKLAFRRCTDLESITISSGLKYIGAGAFLDCSRLISINVYNDNPVYCSIGGVLLNKTKDTLILYPKGKRGSYTIPNGVRVIDTYAFVDCSSLTTVMIPSGVTTIGESAFLNCTGLTSVTIPNSVTAIGYQAFLKSGLTSVTIPNGMTKIEASTFGFCKSLTSVTIPRSVTSIIDNAFYNCPNLTSVTCLNPIPPVIDADRAFHRIHSARANLQPATLYVPASSLKAYKQADGWSNFDKIRPVEN